MVQAEGGGHAGQGEKVAMMKRVGCAIGSELEEVVATYSISG